MCNVCDCGAGLKSLGVVGCPALFGRAYKYVFLPYFKEDGTINGLDLSSDPVLNEAYFTALLTQESPWLPSPQVLNGDSTREDDKFETFNNDTVSLFVQQGKRNVMGIFAQIPANVSDTVKSYNCTQMGMYVITESGQLIGMEGDGWKVLNPIKIEKGSFGAIFKPQSNTSLNVQQTGIKFNYDISECDGNLKMIASDDFTGYDIKQLSGLVQVEFKVFASASTTTLKVAADTNQGAITSPILVEGLVASDFVIKNVTDNSTVSKTVAESAGKYTFTFSAQTAGDEGLLTCTKDGYSFTPFKFNFV